MPHPCPELLATVIVIGICASILTEPDTRFGTGNQESRQETLALEPWYIRPSDAQLGALRPLDPGTKP